ncbi:putative tubulin, partial [Toxoplasma gondii GAB2-2007-GAL-DOM2]
MRRMRCTCRCLAAAFLVRGAGISVSDLLNNIG